MSRIPNFDPKTTPPQKKGKKNLEILTWVGEFRPGNKTIHTVVDEESDFQVKNQQFLRPEGKIRKNEIRKKIEKSYKILINFLFFFFGGGAV